MPTDFKQLMAHEGDTVIVHQLTFPGTSLRGQLNHYRYSKKGHIDFTKLGKYKNKGKSIDFIKQHRYKNRGADMERMMLMPE